MINKDVPRLKKLLKVLSISSIEEEIDMALKLRKFFDKDLLQNDEHPECLNEYFFKQAYDLLVSHIASILNIDDED